MFKGVNRCGFLYAYSERVFRCLTLCDPVLHLFKLFVYRKYIVILSEKCFQEAAKYCAYTLE